MALMAHGAIRYTPKSPYRDDTRVVFFLSPQPFMIGASAAWMRAICAGVVMLVSSLPKCGCRTPEMMYCQR